MTDDAILDAIVRREGGFVFHAADRGKATNFGITLETLSAWRGKPCTVEDVKRLTETEARRIYQVRYVAPLAGVPEDLKPQMVDIAVNSGVSRARMLLAKAQQAGSTRSMNTELAIERLKFYADIVKRNPSQSAFIAGWVSRACEFI